MIHETIRSGTNVVLAHHGIPVILTGLAGRVPLSMEPYIYWHRFQAVSTAVGHRLPHSPLIVITSRPDDNQVFVLGIVKENHPGSATIRGDGRAVLGCSQMLYFGPNRCAIRQPLEAVLDASPGVSEIYRRRFDAGRPRVLLDGNILRMQPLLARAA